MQVGSSRVEITPKELCNVAGQMVPRMAKYVHDPIYCNTVIFKKGDTVFSLTSNDTVSMNDDVVANCKKILSEKYNLPEMSFNFHAVHTHCAPYVKNDSGIAPINEEFVKDWQEKIIKSVDIAMENLEECDVYSGEGYVEYMGFNRRGRREDGTVEMYWGAENDDFVGTEGPRDGSVTVIFAKRKSDDSLKVIVPNFSTHPNSVEGEYFISADDVGRTRQVLWSIFGEEVDVVYLTGAAGNTAPSDLYDNRGFAGFWRGEKGLNRSGIYLGSEIAKTVAGTCEPMEDDTLSISQTVMNVPYRSLDYEYDPVKDRTFSKEAFEGYKESIKKLAEKGDMKMDCVVARIGDSAICTVGGELYCEFGLDVKEESPAKHTIIAELTNGGIGYIPIYEATINGGYSAMFPGSKCKEDTGYRWSAKTKTMLLDLFKDKE